MIPIIRVSDKILKWLQDNGIVGKDPIKFPSVKKEDMPQLVVKPPSFNIRFEDRYIVDPNGQKHNIFPDEEDKNE